MTVKRVNRRAQAERDIDAAAAHYYAEGGEPLELRFIYALDAALKHIARSPATGSTRYTEMAQRADLRFWPLKRFPYLIFYIELADRIDVLRVLHGSRDIPATLREGDGEADSDG